MNNQIKSKINLIRFKTAEITGKLTYTSLKILKKSGTALPGKIALSIYPKILKEYDLKTKNKIVVTGSNGKTTTNNIIRYILNEVPYNTVSNNKGSNMKQGVLTSYFISPVNKKSKRKLFNSEFDKENKNYNIDQIYDWASLEVDEGSIKSVINDLNINYLLITNLFKDQLDRYVEINLLIDELYQAIEKSTENKEVNKLTNLILNGDDPNLSAFYSLENKKIFFGVETDYITNDNTENNSQKTDFHLKDSDLTLKENNFSFNENSSALKEHTSLFKENPESCPLCGDILIYNKVNFGSLGDYYCKCGFKRPKLDYYISDVEFKKQYCSFSFNTKNKKFENIKFAYPAIYNLYNCCGAIAFAFEIGLDPPFIFEKVSNFRYNLGRMDTFKIKNKRFHLFLSKNSVGLNEILKNIANNPSNKSLIFDFNDFPPDGEDTSWIWDSNFEIINEIPNIKSIYSIGHRDKEISLRLKYAGFDMGLCHNYNSANEVISLFLDEKHDEKYKIFNERYKIINHETIKEVFFISTFTSLDKNQKILKKIQEENE